MFHEIWRQGLLDDDARVGIDWAWLAADRAMTKAPLGGEQTGPNPTDRAKRGEALVLTEAAGVPIGLAHDGADRHDTKLLEATLASTPIARPIPTEEAPQACAWTAATTTTRFASSPPTSGSSHTSAPAARRSRPRC